jgi:hypothetical protein
MFAADLINYMKRDYFTQIRHISPATSISQAAEAKCNGLRNPEKDASFAQSMAKFTHPPVFPSCYKSIDGVWMLSARFRLRIPIKTRFEALSSMVSNHDFHEHVYQHGPWSQCCHILIHGKTACIPNGYYVDCLHIYDDLFSCP